MNRLITSGGCESLTQILQNYIDSQNPKIWDIPITGRAGGTVATNGTMVFSAETDIGVESYGGVNIVSVTRAADGAYRSHTVVFSCMNTVNGGIKVYNSEKVVSLGNHNGFANPSTNFYSGVDATAPILNWNLNQIPVNVRKIRQVTELLTSLPTIGNGAMPLGLTYLTLLGININWTWNGGLPVGLTYLWLAGTNINWTWNGGLPVGLTHINLQGNNINWTWNGAMPVGLTLLYLLGANINWTWNGAMPVGLTYLSLQGNTINWTYTGAMPVGLMYLLLSSNNINWTGILLQDVTTPLNWTFLQLNNFRNPNSTLTSAELLVWLQNIKNNTGTLPATINLREYDNIVTTTAIQSATPNISGTTAEQLRYWVNQVLTGKGCTTVQINLTNITL